MHSPERVCNVVDLAKSSPRQTDVVYSTNESPKVMSQPQPFFVRDDDFDSTCKGSSSFSSSTFPSYSSSLSSSSPPPSNSTKHSSVLSQGLHGSHPQLHDATHLFQNLSLLDNTYPDDCKSIARRQLPLSRLPTSSRPGSKNEQKIKKSIPKKKRTPFKFRYYRHPGAMTAITSAMEALDARGDGSTNTAAVNGLDHSLVIRLKYKGPESAATLTTDERAVNSAPIQHQRVGKRDIMRITSVLNNPAQTTSSPSPSSFDSSGAASDDDASPSSPQAPSLNMPDRHIEDTSTDILDPMPNHNHNHDTANARYQFAKSGLRKEYIDMLTHPERQRYEDALVEIVGDLELPFFGNRFGSGHG